MQKVLINPVLSLNPIDLILTVILVTQISPINFVQFTLMGPIAIIHVTVFSWSQHVFLDNERTSMHKLAAIRASADSFQIHHNDPGLVCKNTSMWFSGTRSHCLYSIPAILTTMMVSMFIKNEYLIWYMIILLSLGYICIRNHIICHASKRGYSIDLICKTGHVYGLLPAPEYHSKHHEHSISCDCPIKLCKCNETICKCFKSGDAHTSHWAFALPRLSEIFENYYKYELGGPKSLRSYQFIEILFWMSNPVMVPINVFIYTKSIESFL